MNKVILIGNLTRDVELKHTASGKSFAKFGLAVNEGFGDKQKSHFFDVIAWEKIADTINNNLSKGAKILIEGRLQQETWDDKETGQKRSKVSVVCTSVEFLSKKQVEQEANKPVAVGVGVDAGVGEEEVPF